MKHEDQHATNEPVPGPAREVDVPDGARDGTDGSADGSAGKGARVEPGLYEHYKGDRYRVIDTVRHSETEEALVLYRALYGERGLWVRPLAMFAGTVERGGATVPRFERIDEA